MDPLPKGFRAFAKKWTPTTYVDACDSDSLGVHLARSHFADAVNEAFPEILQQFRAEFFEPRPSTQNVVPLKREGESSCRSGPRHLSGDEASHLKPRARAFLARWNLGFPWMVEFALTTLQDWSNPNSTLSVDLQRDGTPQLQKHAPRVRTGVTCPTCPSSRGAVQPSCPA